MTPRKPTTQRATEHLREELAYLKLPAPTWPAASQSLDVAIIGAGMFGIAAAVALRLNGVSNICLFDDNPAGRSGPWTTYARMRTLRSPKDLPGLALGIRALTFRAWYEAVYGVEAWDALYKIPNAVWQDYLDWIAEAFELPIEHQTAILDFKVSTQGVTLQRADGQTLTARQLVIATGRAGSGGVSLPGFIDPALFPAQAAHSTDAIDFTQLAGQHVAVLGAGSSAWDNAATALEQGAAKVTMYARRSHLPQVNKARGYIYPGFIAGWHSLAPAQQWEVATYLEDTPPPPPHETVLRTLAAGEDRFQLRLDSRIQAIGRLGDQVQVKLADRTDHVDFLIAGTGFHVDLSRARLFAQVADRVALWRDRFEPATSGRHRHLGLYPWLGSGFELQEVGKADGDSELNRVHLLNHAASLSFGSIASDIPAISAAAQRLALRVVSQLFTESFEVHRQQLLDWELEWELEKTPYLHRP